MGVIFSAGLTSALLPKFGPRPLATGGTFIASIGFFILSNLKPESTYVSGVLPSLLIISIGLGLTFVSLASTALFNVSGQDTGAASAVLNTAQQLGGSFGTAIQQTIVVSTAASFTVAAGANAMMSKDYVMAAKSVHGYDQAFRFGGVVMFVASVVFFFFVNIDRHHLGQHDQGSVAVH